MRLALSDERPPRLLVICNDSAEHARIGAAVGLLGRRAEQAGLVAGLLGLRTEPVEKTIDDVTLDIGLTGLEVEMEGLTGWEEIFSTETHQITVLRSAAALAVSVVGEESVVETGLTTGLWSAEEAPRRQPYYRVVAERALQQTVTDLTVSLVRDIPHDVSVTYPAAHPLAQALPTVN